MKTEDMKKFLRDGEITVKHATGILVGCAGAGKTTLLKRLQGKNIQDTETDSIRGLEVNFHAFEIKDRRLEACEHEMQKTLRVREFESEKRNTLKQSDIVLYARDWPKLPIETESEPKAEFQSESEFKSISVDMIPGEPTTKQEENSSQDQSASGLISDDQIRKMLSDKEKTFRITMVDTTGQLATFACLQTYFTDKAFYVLVLDMTKPFDTIVEQEEMYGRDSIFAKWTYEEYLRFWIHSIKAVGNKRALVFLVASHAEGKTKKEINKYFEEVFDLVREDKSWLKMIVGDKKYALALKDCCYENRKKLDDLKQKMVETLSKKGDLSVKVRASWALMEDLLRNSNKKMMTRNEIRQTIQIIGSDCYFANEKEMTNFLSYFHDHGFLLYFDEEHLREHAILDIQWFVNAFIIITSDKIHFGNDNADKNHIKKQWEQFDETGVLTNDLLNALWVNDKILLECKDPILFYMERLQMIFAMDGDWYIPCMNKKHVTSKKDKPNTSFLFETKSAHDVKKDEEKQSSAEGFKRNRQEHDISMPKRLKKEKEITSEKTEKESKIDTPVVLSDVEFSNTIQTKDYLTILIHETESSLKAGHITNDLKRLLDTNEELMSLPRHVKLSLREKLESIVTNHFREKTSSEKFMVTLASKENSLHFVVLCEDNAFQEQAKQRWMTYIKTDEVKKESYDVMTHEMNKPLSDVDKKKLDEFFSTKFRSSGFNTLFKKHSNLNSVSFTKGKSINYGSQNWRVTDEICIVLQCFHKDYIPFGESSFPSEIGNYPTDVREGHCSLSAKTTVQMGRSVYTNSNQMAACLGNFVNFGKNSTGFITCAHSIIPITNFRNISSLEEYHGTAIYDTETRTKIGQVEDLHFDLNVKESVDAALVSLDPDTQIVPGFPEINMDQMQHAGFLSQHLCISSSVVEIDKSNRTSFVVKYGPETHLTAGTLELGVISFKPFHWDIKENLPSSSRDTEEFVMYNQIKINRLVNESKFLNDGDSGSFVFMVDEQDKALKCIGMLIGRTSSYEGIMTPIHRILDKLKITNGLMSFLQPVPLLKYFSNPMTEILMKMNFLQEKVGNIDSVVHRLDERIRPLENDYRQRQTEEMEQE